MPIDDATVEWNADEAPIQNLGTLQIPPQKFTDKNRIRFCENISFSPANTPSGFEPLGTLNQVRIAVYAAISKYRHEKNLAAVPDPLLEWDQ
jgi:catalase